MKPAGCTARPDLRLCASPLQALERGCTGHRDGMEGLRVPDFARMAELLRDRAVFDGPQPLPA